MKRKTKERAQKKRRGGARKKGRMRKLVTRSRRIQDDRPTHSKPDYLDWKQKNGQTCWSTRGERNAAWMSRDMTATNEVDQLLACLFAGRHSTEEGGEE